MKKILLLLFLLSPVFSFGITVTVDNFSPIKVYFTNFRSNADIIICYNSFPSHKETEWQMISGSWADLKIAPISFESNATLKVYISSSCGEAKWVNEKHTLYGKLGKK